MGHVIDEVVLNFGITLLAENQHNGENKRNEQYHREGQRGNHEAYRREDVAAHIREMNLHHAHFRLGGCSLEEQLRIAIFLALFRIVRTTIDFTAVGGRNGEMIGNINSVIHQFGTNVLIEHAEINTLLEGFVAGCIEYVINYLIKQCFLIDITLTHNFLHRLSRFRK